MLLAPCGLKQMLGGRINAKATLQVALLWHSSFEAREKDAVGFSASPGRSSGKVMDSETVCPGRVKPQINIFDMYDV